MVDRLITNFHLPRSTLLMLVCAFAGMENTMRAYRHAVTERYRFFSYGDAMLIDRSPRCALPRRRRTDVSMRFDVLARDGQARRGRLTLAHGAVETPAFMPVGTYGAVKAVSPAELKEIGAQIVLSNTFHLWLRPGIEVIECTAGCIASWAGRGRS